MCCNNCCTCCLKYVHSCSHNGRDLYISFCMLDISVSNVSIVCTLLYVLYVCPCISIGSSIFAIISLFFNTCTNVHIYTCKRVCMYCLYVEYLYECASSSTCM